MVIVLGFLFALSIICDLHGYYIKTSKYPLKQAQVIALGNWVVYVARILNVVFATTLGFLFELQLSIRLSEVFFIGFLLAFMVSIFYLASPLVERGLNFLLGIIIYRPFPELQGIQFWRKVSFGIGSRVLSMFVSANFIYLALILPFLMAKLFPEFRMTAVFIGQFMNFIATAILLSYVEPKIMYSFDTNEPNIFLDGFIFGRVILVGLMATLSSLWFLLI